MLIAFVLGLCSQIGKQLMQTSLNRVETTEDTVSTERSFCGCAWRMQ